MSTDFWVPVVLATAVLVAAMWWFLANGNPYPNSMIASSLLAGGVLVGSGWVLDKLHR